MMDNVQNRISKTGDCWRPVYEVDWNPIDGLGIRFANSAQNRIAYPRCLQAVQRNQVFDFDYTLEGTSYLSQPLRNTSEVSFNLFKRTLCTTARTKVFVLSSSQ